jgi:hypothetical protein
MGFEFKAFYFGKQHILCMAWTFTIQVSMAILLWKLKQKIPTPYSQLLVCEYLQQDFLKDWLSKHVFGMREITLHLYTSCS